MASACAALMGRVSSASIASMSAALGPASRSPSSSLRGDLSSARRDSRSLATISISAICLSRSASCATSTGAWTLAFAALTSSASSRRCEGVSAVRTGAAVGVGATSPSASAVDRRRFSIESSTKESSEVLRTAVRTSAAGGAFILYCVTGFLGFPRPLAAGPGLGAPPAASSSTTKTSSSSRSFDVSRRIGLRAESGGAEVGRRRLRPALDASTSFLYASTSRTSSPSVFHALDRLNSSCDGASAPPNNTPAAAGARLPIAPDAAAAAAAATWYPALNPAREWSAAMSGVALAMRSAPARNVRSAASRIDALLTASFSVPRSDDAPLSENGVIGLGPWA
mmetsp:Transcript_6685/g.27237  ORF Transcript_6685/g.27237 Transcript_6685/m.27237 type:complete len:340 (-) Transcript_6685:919-1938(-)